ncbi:MAG: tRNA (adenosine(37)-N6)-threonylcarbamoyltransferase complex ATPase subunit type 1 TsaE [Rudaea sp.]
MADTSPLEFRQIDEAQLVLVANRLAPAVTAGGVIHLHGALGAGKTTFARALVRALGVGARVKSPTYSLIESYAVGELSIQHLDLYRIAAMDEVEWLGLRDLDGKHSLWLIEWPERATGAIPVADLRVCLAHAQMGRDLRFEALTEVGRHWLSALEFAERSSTGTVS